MLHLTKETLLSLNQLLSHLLSAQVPLSIGETIHSSRAFASQDSLGATQRFLLQVNDVLETAGPINEPMESYVAKQFPKAVNYQHALKIYANSGSISLALEQLRIPTRTRSHATGNLGKALVYPTIVSILVAIGFAIVCVFTTPTITSLYEQAQEHPPAGVQFLELGRNFLYQWLTLFPLILCGIWIWWIKKGKQYAWRWIPGNDAYYKATLKAYTAQLITRLMDSGCEQENAIHLASKQTVITEPNKNGQKVTESSLLERRHQTASPTMPPLINWAIQNSEEDGQPISETLPMISEVYANTAKRESQSWQTVLPMIAGVTFGGILIFSYVFSLFIPIIEMLYDLSNPNNGLGGT